MSAVADKLREARALIERGWTQERFKRETGGRIHYCATGALSAVAGLGEIVPLCLALEDAIGVDSTQAVWGWNDAPERTQAEVLAAFDKAIERAEAGQ